MEFELLQESGRIDKYVKHRGVATKFCLGGADS